MHVALPIAQFMNQYNTNFTQTNLKLDSFENTKHFLVHSSVSRVYTTSQQQNTHAEHFQTTKRILHCHKNALELFFSTHGVASLLG